MVGVEYRLAPEHPFPAALDDVAGTVRRIVVGDELDVEPGRVILMGFSAGANLAAAYTLLSQRSDELPCASGLVLHYPCLDVSERFDGCSSDCASLKADTMAAYSDLYAGECNQCDPLISPLHASDSELADFPRTVLAPVVGDVLLGQSECFRERLLTVSPFGRDRVIWQPVDGVEHGYVERDLNTAHERSFVTKTIARSLEPLLGPVLHDIPFPIPEDSE